MSARCSALRTSTGVAPASARARPCSLKSPCSASTPAFTSVTPARGGLPAAILQPGLERADLEPGHRVAEAVRELRQYVGVLEVRGRLDDGSRHGGRVLALEDARSDEDAVDAELH